MAEALIAVRDGALKMLPFTDGGVYPLFRLAVGHVVDVKRDGWAWQALEDPRNFGTTQERRFALIRFPGVSVERIQKYLAPQPDQFMPAFALPARERLWQIQWQSLPLVARNILIATGVLTIGGPTPDFTWAQVQAFVTRQDTGASDTDPLT